MKKSEIGQLKLKSKEELSKLADAKRSEIAKLRLELKVNPPKDTNTLTKKKKYLAVILSLLSSGGVNYAKNS